MKKVDLDWLQKTNEEFKLKGIVDSEDKTWKACQKWRDENVSEIFKDTNIDHQIVSDYLDEQDSKIEEYFLTQTTKNRGWVSPPFSGVYYFAGNFWEITIPLAFGRVRIDFFQCVKMPNELKQNLHDDKDKLNEFVNVSCDCLDYGMEIDGINRVCSRDYSKELFGSGDKHLRSAISLLVQEKASSKAIDDARMAIEIFQKAYLSVKDTSFGDKEAIKISHHLERGLDECVSKGLVELSGIRKNLSIFPDISARYDSDEKTFGELWSAYKLAQFVATTTIRDFTGRDSRKLFLGKS
ncbi:MAG: hypothetical protein ACR2MG_17175 [Pyrinomonadaceae bacterium]